VAINMNSNPRGAKPIALNNAALPELRERLPVPGYDRSSLGESIVHIGVGNFHRSHLAVYIDDLLSLGAGGGLGIVGVGLLPRDQEMARALKSQDCLYCLVERDASGDRPRVVGSIKRFIWAPEDPEAVLEAISSTSCNIVSMTVTEGGYFIDPATGEFDAGHPEIAASLAEPRKPTNVYSYLGLALALRRKRGMPGVTLLSCDNIQSNGDTLRRCLLAYLHLARPAWANQASPLGSKATAPSRIPWSTASPR
jgi:mannitol 2-dehydrogenase